ncbi:MAG: hydroxylamine reductase [Phycisphaerales bacterium]|mgnify:CR=1 FL=1|jgi:hydroxylamine reductase|nr:hydroxylamine reductase [Phycisphaerales bacterium]MBT7170650.1 hydroxylamine reductase [Phycisphaerales bacterium]
MFCYQCEQTAQGTGCTKVGVCGKSPEAAALQDLLVEMTKELSAVANPLRHDGWDDPAVNNWLIDALFTTVTNVNFDTVRLEQLLREGATVLTALCAKASTTTPLATLPATTGELLALADAYSVSARREALGDDVAGLQELLVYGLKGTAAYVHHARVLGQEDPDVYTFFYEALAFLTSDGSTDVDALVGTNLRCGEVNFRVMELLDTANTGLYGNPEPTSVKVTATAGKAILVSGHDLGDLAALLEQTEGKGINIYTHGEMLPCHAYPELKKYPHLVGNYGGAWQDQKKEFDAFPGAILMTTNCIQQPRDSYLGRIFTCGLVAFPGAAHIDGRDFAPVIEAALAADGFAETEEPKEITVGFGHQAVLSVAPAVIDAVKSGALRHFFLIGGCDGAKPGRNYYTELAEAVPQDCAILTLACGKYRFNKLDFGDIGGIPRLLDIGQCNDAYSAIRIALALAEAFECGVNELPLSLVLSWYEQKAVCILLTLLALGVKNIRIGPSLPAFVSPTVLGVLVDTFGLTPVSTPEKDLKAMLGN